MPNINLTKKTRDELAAGARLLRDRGQKDGLVLAVEKVVDAHDAAAKKTKAAK